MPNRIRKNAATSPLLLLPSEVRENILIHLVGDNLIHVKYLVALDLYYANRAEDKHLNPDNSEDDGSEEPLSNGMVDTDNDNGDDNYDFEIAVHEARLASSVAGLATSNVREQTTQPTFRHAICVANQSEQSAYEEAISGHAVVPEGESPEFYVASCKERHAACKMCGSGPMFLQGNDRKALRVDLNVLGVCRQLYEEANHLLWATNTFSFDDPKTLQKFLASLNPAQKRNLTNIHIGTIIGGYHSSYADANYRARHDDSYWGKALKLSCLNILRGVQALHLCLRQGFQCIQAYSNVSAEEMIETALQSDMDPILRLRTLSVKDVTVIVSDDATELEKNRKSVHRWTAKKKMDYAESIRVQLMDPGGAELVKTEAEAANLARKTEIKENAEARVKSYQRVLKSRHNDMIRNENRASQEEAKAILAAQKADTISKKRPKKAAQLQEAAERQKEVAARARNVANYFSEKEKLCQEELNSAKEKYKRATARLGATPEDFEDEQEVKMLMEGLSGSDMDVDDEKLASRPEEEASDEDDEISS